jgi:hypothetical protein
VGHYETQDVEFGKVYKWVPADALIECECGQLFTTEGITASSCPRCSADYTRAVRRLVGQPPKEDDTSTTNAQRKYQKWMKGEEYQLSHPKPLYSWGLFSSLAAKDERSQILDLLYGG